MLTLIFTALHCISFVCMLSIVLLSVCVCVCVCVCVLSIVLLSVYVCVCVHTAGEVWVHNPEDTSSNPRAGGKKTSKSTPAHPSIKWIPGLVLGVKYALAVSHYALLVLVGLPGANTGSVRYGQSSCEFLAWAPGGIA